MFEYFIFNEDSMKVEIFQEIFLNENKYTFLEKIYDSNSMDSKPR